jgi:hypothetical protein
VCRKEAREEENANKEGEEDANKEEENAKKEEEEEVGDAEQNKDRQMQNHVYKPGPEVIDNAKNGDDSSSDNDDSNDSINSQCSGVIPSPHEVEK